MNFQRIILTIAIVLLILCLILIGIVLVNSKNSQQWPPMVGDCPDYWVDLSGNGAQCVNVKNLGSCNFGFGNSKYQTMDFTQAPFSGNNGLCAKYNWANGCKLTWDGITYGVPNPCDASGNNQ
jgi:hypothetical protein